MTRTTLIAALALGASALATPALADVKEDYVAACLAAYGEESTDFCNCKATEVGKEDEEFARALIAFYQDPAKFREDLRAGNVPEAVQAAWPRFVMQSNKLCRPGDDA